MSIAVVGAIFVVSPSRRASDTPDLSAAAAQARAATADLAARTMLDHVSTVRSEKPVTTPSDRGSGESAAALGAAKLLSDLPARVHEVSASRQIDIVAAHQTSPHAALDTLRSSDRRAAWRGSLAE